MKIAVKGGAGGLKRWYLAAEISRETCRGGSVIPSFYSIPITSIR